MKFTYNKNHSYTGIQMLATLPHRKDRATCLLEFFWKEGRIGWLVKFLWNNGQFHDNLHLTADVVFIASSPLSQYHIDLLSDGNPSHLGIPKKNKHFLIPSIQDADNMSEDWRVAEMWLYLSRKEVKSTTLVKLPLHQNRWGNTSNMQKHLLTQHAITLQQCHAFSSLRTACSCKRKHFAWCRKLTLISSRLC